MKTNELTIMHYELLSEIRNAKGPFNYYKSNFSLQEQKYLNELVVAGEVLKIIERYKHNGRYSTRILLSIKR